MATDTTSPVTDPILDDKSLEPRKKPIEDAGQAHGVAKRLFSDRSQPNESLGIIRRKYDGEPPLNPKMLERLAQFWRANFSVKSLSTAVTRFAQGFTSFDDSRRYLTASKLPEVEGAPVSTQIIPLPAPAQLPALPAGGAPPAAPATTPPSPLPVPDALATAMEKSERFQRAITKTVRAWPGWRPTKNQIINENSLYGFAMVGWLDPIEWRPTAFTFDQCAIPVGSTHDVNDVKSVVFRKAFAIDEMIDFIKDRDAAETAGWNVDNVVSAVNRAMPKDERGKDGSRSLEYADAIREGNYAKATSDNAKVVDCYIVFFREYSGKVSQYIVLQGVAESEDDDEKGGGRELFYGEERFERMGDVAGLFSLQWGDGKYYGSIGLGRTLVGLHHARDVNYCMMMDMCVLNAMMRRRGDKAQDPNRAPFRLQYPMLILEQEEANTMDPHKADVGTLLQVDEQLSGQIQQLSNTFLPTATNDGGEKATAREIIENARRVDATNGDLLARWYAQDCAMLETIQRRIASRDNLKAAKDYLELEQSGKILLSQDEWDFLKDDETAEGTAGYALNKIPSHLDADAVMCCVGMMRDGLTSLDIYRLARQPVAEPMGDTPDIMAQKSLFLWNNFKGDPDVNQYRLKELVMQSGGSPELADELLLPESAQATAGLEADRAQLLELTAMNAAGGLGAPINVSPNDNHAVHCQTIENEYASKVPPDDESLATNPPLIKTTALALQHYNGHVAFRRQAGEKGPAIEHATDWAAHVGSRLSKASAILQTKLAQQQQAATAALPDNPSALPAQPQAQLPMAA